MTAPWLEHLRSIVTRYIDPKRYDWTPAVDPIPVGRKAMLETYGDPAPVYRDGRWVADPKWERGRCHTVAASLIPGYDRRIYMHSLAAPHFVEAMRRSVQACPSYRFVKIGCFNVRRQRHDTPAKAAKANRKLRPWSDHYLGIAFDLNAHRNGWAPSTLNPWGPGWDQYSDLPRGVVEAWESVGFEWGGRWRGKRDSMHMSLRRTR